MRRGLAESRERAREAIQTGRVLVSGSVAMKPARLVDPAEPVEITGPPQPYVSRGGLKLAAALDAFSLDVHGWRCLDLGASTGGFTDCLLQRGATEVVAVDVGVGQLAWSIRQDPRVKVHERTDVRDLDVGELGTFALVTADLAFISLRTVMSHLVTLAGSGWLLVLVKPQFEVGRGRVGKGGVVRDPVLHQEAIDEVVRAAMDHGLVRKGVCPSPVTGADGNREFFVLLRRGDG